MTKQDFNEGLLGFLDASPTPFHATRNMAGMFRNAGFIELREVDKWQLEEGEKYFVTRNDSSIIAFTFPHAKEFAHAELEQPKGCSLLAPMVRTKESLHAKSYVMIGAHTDSPNLRLKPNPIIKNDGVVKFGVEPYGGVLLNPWFDRDLSLAGRISYLNSSNKLQDALIDVQRAIAIIPSLAIHLERDVNNSKSINAQTDISPILACGDSFNFDAFLKEELLACGVEDVVELYANELSLYDTQKASYVGIDKDFIASARLDNLLSCYVGMLTLCSVQSDMPMLFIASDHEEVGSDSSSGAGGSFLESTLKRMFGNFEEYTQMIRSSLLISADNAHAIHPNYPSKHDKEHAPQINKGVVVKVNANQRYASNSKTIARFLNVASAIDAPTQNYVTRSDMGCGSTIGPITATRLGIDTLDVGLPTFAMHSIRELCGSDDAYSLYQIILGFSHK